MKLIKYILLLSFLIVILVSFIPLNWYYSSVSKNMRPLELEQISGSVVKGAAQNAKYLSMNLGQADWLIYPSSYNELTVDFSLNDQHYDINGKYVKKREIDSLKDIFGTFDWSLIKKYLNFNHGEISGYIRFDFDRIEIKNSIPERIIGKAVTKELQLVKPVKKDLGEIEVVFVSDNPSIIVGQVNSQSNVLNVSGAIYIHKNHRWEIKLTLIPMPGEYEIEYALQNIGDKRRGGGRSLNIAGFY